MTDLVDKSVEERFHIRYLTHYDYAAEVIDNLNALRVRPAVTARQRLEEFSVRVTPEARLHRHDDYFGTEVIEFEVSRPHRSLTIDVRARVAVGSQAQPADARWETLQTDAYREAGGEFLVQTDDAPGHPLLVELQRQTGIAGSPLDAVTMVSELIADRFEYRQGATYVNSPITDTLDGGAGVCQDFSHIALNLLRYHGIAGRYVSGYLYSPGQEASEQPPPDAVAAGPDQPSGPQSVEVDTHAWVEALLPGEDGSEPQWFGVDPTNRAVVGPRHVKIGHGRDYADVPPIKGVYWGTASSELSASVTMTRVDGVDAPSLART